MLIAVILGGAVCPKPISKVQFWMITFSRSMYEKTTFPKIDIGSDDLSQIEATWLLTPPACPICPILTWLRKNRFLNCLDGVMFSLSHEITVCFTNVI